MLTTEERRLHLVELVREMRTAQKKFFLSRCREDIAEYRALLDDAQYHERQVDRALKRLPMQRKCDA